MAGMPRPVGGSRPTVRRALSVRPYLVPGAAGVVALAVGAFLESERGALAALAGGLFAAGFAGWMIERHRRRPLLRSAPIRAPVGSPSSRLRRPDLNHRFLPLQSTVQLGELRSGGPVAATVAEPVPALIREVLSADPDGSVPGSVPLGGRDRPADDRPPVPPPPWRIPLTGPPAGTVGEPLDPSRSGASRSPGGLWAEAENPWPPHLRAPREDRLRGRPAAPFERRMPRGRLPHPLADRGSRATLPPASSSAEPLGAERGRRNDTAEP